MRTNKKQKDKMAPWRKDLPDLPERWREEEFDGDNASFDTYSPDNDKETDSNESGTGVREQSEVCSSKKKKRKGRRSVWEERYIFTNTKNSKNAEIHANVLKELD